MKKGIIIFCLTVYIFASVFVFPVHRASANPLAAAVPAGIEIGAGVYVTGAIALAALAGAFGYTQYSDDIRQHAAAVWASANDTVKRSLKASIEAAAAAGKNAITISRDVYDYILSKVGVITDAVRNTFTVPKSTRNTIYSQWGRAELLGDDIYLTPSKRYVLINYVDGEEFNAYYDRTSFKVNFYEEYGSKYVTWGTSDKTVQVDSFLQLADIVSVITWYNNVMAPVGVSLALVPVSQVDSVSSNDIKSSGKLAWNETTDTPVIALPNSFPATSVTGKTLTWDPDAGVWKDASGAAVPQSDVVVGSPELVLNPDGIAYKDVATGDLVGVKEGTIVDSPPVEDTGVLEDILTGVQTIADVLTTGLVGDTSKINWDRLKMAGSAFTTAFPFSIPWDIGRAFDAVFGSFEDLRDMPEWHWTIRFAGHDYTIDFGIDDYFLSWFEIIRSVMLILFDVGLVYAVRKMLGGAS